MTATVDISGISHRFGDFTALDNINLQFAAGNYAVLLGPSGCGKTTLLSVLGGFIHPSEGQVLLNGTDVTRVPPAERPTTTMFQDYALFPHMTLVDNVGFGLRMRGVGRAERTRRAREFLDLVGLDASFKKKPHELSGGQRQRVALARALAVDPDVLLLDEPLGALDLKLRRQMQGELKAIQKRVGTTFVHVTHDQDEAMAIADQIIVMNTGRVEDQGTPKDIYLQPETLFSAGFMGETNIIKGEVSSIASGVITVNTSAGAVDFDENSATGSKTLQTGDSVGLCFRPEHVRNIDHDSANANIAQPGGSFFDLGDTILVDRAFFGTHQRCQLQATDGNVYLANLPQTLPLSEGQMLPLMVHKPSVVVVPA